MTAMKALVAEDGRLTPMLLPEHGIQIRAGASYNPLDVVLALEELNVLWPEARLVTAKQWRAEMDRRADEAAAQWVDENWSDEG